LVFLPDGPVLPTGSAEELVRWLRPRFGLFGITRLADVTGLDRLGVPVAVCCRPNGRGLSVSQGKGLTRAQAGAGALMESIETWHAETPALAEIRASPRAVAGDPGFLDLTRLSPPRGSRLRPDLSIPWLPGRDLASGSEVLVPAELVELDTTRPPSDGRGCFTLTTSGLASGRSPAEAALHALLELVERDALTLWSLRDPCERAASRIDLSTLRRTELVELLERLRAAGMLVAAWDVTSDLGVPTVLCHLMADRPGPHDPGGWEFGSACRADPEAALLAALLEAVQARLTQITGSRDDIGRDRYAAIDPLRLARHRSVLRRSGGRPLPPPAWEADLPARAQLARLLERLAGRGLGSPVLVDLSRPEIGVPVVKLVLPDLEDGFELEGWVPGRRARALGARP
jgi:ribosomal protein S12 methylthiotransferase accessory factor